MLTLYILQQLAAVILTIILALTGIYLIIRIYTAKEKTDITTLKARVFLDGSFLKDSLAILLVICLFFIINAATEVNDILELFSEGSTGISELSVRSGDLIETLIEELAELGVLVCTVVLIYKWFKLIRPSRPLI